MIASTLSLSDATIHTHLKNIYKKLEVSSKGEAITKAYKEGIIQM